VQLLVRSLGLSRTDAAALLRAAQPRRDRAPGSPSGPARHNLPAELSSFVGREQELTKLTNPWLQRTRKVLGSTAANEALEYGRGLRLETAIALALEALY
jgi:hypothetical protein